MNNNRNFLMFLILLMVLLFTVGIIYAKELPLDIVLQTGHTDSITSISFSPDGKYMATGSYGNIVKLWDVETGKEIRSFMGQERGSFIEAGFSPNGKYIITNSLGATLWDAESGRRLRRYATWFLPILSPDSKSIVASFGKKIKYLDMATGKEIKTFIGHSGYVTGVSFSPDGKYFVSVSSDTTAILWNVKTGKIKRIFKGHAKEIASLDFSPDGKYILTGSRDKTAILWNAKNGKAIKTFKGYIFCVDQVEFSPDGKYIAIVDSRNARLWNAKTLKEIEMFKDPLKSARSVSFSPDSKHIAVGKSDGNIKLLDIKTGKEVKIFKGYSYYIFEASLSSDGRFFVTGCSDNTAKLWDMSTGKQIMTFKGHSAEVVGVSFSPDDKYIATGSEDKTVRLWDVKTGKTIKIFKNPHRLEPVELSPDGKYIATGHVDAVRLWNIKTGKIVRVLEGQSGWIRSLNFSSDGKYIVTASQHKDTNMVVLWDVRTGKKIKAIKGSYVSKFSPSGKYAVIVRDGVKLFNSKTNKEIKTFRGISAFMRVNISPDGKYLAVGTSKRTIELWDTTTNKIIRTLKGHLHYITSIFFVGKDHLITSSASGKIKIWDINTGKCLIDLISVDEKDWATITPDGFFDASEGAKKHIRFVKGFKIFSLDQFFDEFYRPGLLSEVISKKKFKRPEISISDRLNKFPPPEVIIVSPASGQKLSNETLKVTVEAKDAGGGIEDIRLYHNGKRVSEDTRGIKIAGKKIGGVIKKNFNITLTNGKNSLRATAFSKKRIESDGHEMIIHLKGISKESNSYILAIGINKYKNTKYNLNYARPDTESFASYIKLKSEKMFKNVALYTLYDTDATRVNILSYLDKIVSQAQVQDVIIIYYAGHGRAVGDDFVFIPTDITRMYEEDDIVKKNSISASEFMEKLQEMKANKLLVVVDACQSGTLTEAFAIRGAAEEKALAQLARSSGIHLLASTQQEQFATEFKELGHGVFTYALLNGIQGAADGSPKDGKITIYELKAYLDDQLPELTKKHKGGAQYPSTFSKGQDFPIILK